MQAMQEMRWPTAEELAEKLNELGWRSTGDAQHEQLTAFWAEFTQKASSLDLTESMYQENEEKLLKHNNLDPQPHHCHKCGLPKVRNQHPQAGEPQHYLEIGCPTECLSCTVGSRHQWYQRAMAAEGKLRLVGIDPTTTREALEDSLAAQEAGKDSATLPTVLPQSKTLGLEHRSTMFFPSSLTHGSTGFVDAAYRGYTLAPLWDNPSDYDKKMWAWGCSVRGQYGALAWPDGTPFELA